jgi:hypothetical protein
LGGAWKENKGCWKPLCASPAIAKQKGTTFDFNQLVTSKATCPAYHCPSLPIMQNSLFAILLCCWRRSLCSKMVLWLLWPIAMMLRGCLQAPSCEACCHHFSIEARFEPKFEPVTQQRGTCVQLVCLPSLIMLPWHLAGNQRGIWPFITFIQHTSAILVATSAFTAIVSDTAILEAN